MKVLYGNICNVTGNWINMKVQDNLNSTFTCNVEIGGYKFIATFDIFQSFGILVKDDCTYKFVETCNNLATAMHLYHKHFNSFNAISLIKFQ